jgi:hypothetical protein
MLFDYNERIAVNFSLPEYYGHSDIWQGRDQL